MTILVRTASLIRYSEIARSAGLDPEQIIFKAGLNRTCLSSPDLRIPQLNLAEVLELSAQTSQFSSIGLQVGESWRLSDFGPLGLLLQHQPSLRTALNEINQYRQYLSDSVAMLVSEQPDHTIIHMNLKTRARRLNRQSAELAIAVLCRLARSILGNNWQPRQVHFMHEAPADLRLHHRFFGQHLFFNMAFNGLVLFSNELDQINPEADPQLASYAKILIESQKPEAKQTVTDQVNHALLLLLPLGRGTIEQVAQNLGISPRTLQRQLEQQGQGFAALVNSLRQDLTLNYLQDHSMPIRQIATLIGFAETSSFTRWFSNQYGCSPSQWKSLNSQTLDLKTSV